MSPQLAELSLAWLKSTYVRPRACPADGRYLGQNYPTPALRLSPTETCRGLGPVHDFPECLDEDGAAILEFQVIRMFPDIQDEDRGRFIAAHHLVILEIDDRQFLRRVLERQG